LTVAPTTNQAAGEAGVRPEARLDPPRTPGGPPLGSDPAVVAMANQADRRNRPWLFVALGIAVTLAALVYLIAGSIRLSSGSTRLQTQRTEAANVESRLDRLARARAAMPDMSEYGSATYMPQRLRSTAADVWGVTVERVATHVNIPTVPDRVDLVNSEGLRRAATTVTISGEPLDRILAFIDQALAREGLESAFVSRLDLRPVPRGWNANIEFRQYESARRN
jgi:hypothetical protein